MILANFLFREHLTKSFLHGDLLALLEEMASLDPPVKYIGAYNDITEEGDIDEFVN